MGTRAGGGCCGGEDAAGPFRDRLELGQRRRVLVRRTLLGCAAALTAAAVILTLAGPPVPAAVAPRLAWAAAVWSAGLVSGWLRQAITTRRPGWRLVIAAAATAAGVVWQPLVPALASVALLAEHVVRTSRPPVVACAPGPAAGNADPVLSQPAAKPG